MLLRWELIKNYHEWCQVFKSFFCNSPANWSRAFALANEIFALQQQVLIFKPLNYEQHPQHVVRYQLEERRKHRLIERLGQDPCRLGLGPEHFALQARLRSRCRCVALERQRQTRHARELHLLQQPQVQVRIRSSSRRQSHRWRRRLVVYSKS